MEVCQRLACMGTSGNGNSGVVGYRHHAKKVSRDDMAAQSTKLLEKISQSMLEKALDILAQNSSLDEVTTQMTVVAPMQITANRLIIIIPEAFGMTLIDHMAKVRFQTSFLAMDRQDKKCQIPNDKEPLFFMASQAAAIMYHSEDRERFMRIALRSAYANAAQAMGTLDGIIFTEPVFLGVPAEIYEEKSKQAPNPLGWVRKLFSR
jgi:hypothetical protein